MSKLKPIYVTLKQGRHKTQPWTFTIDRPGPQNKETKRERYATMWSAWRGARRVLGAVRLFASDDWAVEEKKDRLRPVKRIVIRRK
jgi:hypothetical protein